MQPGNTFQQLKIIRFIEHFKIFLIFKSHAMYAYRYMICYYNNKIKIKYSSFSKTKTYGKKKLIF